MADRFETIVSRYRKKHVVREFLKDDVTTLLRRQFAQLRQVVVTQQRWQHDPLDHLVTEPDGEWVRRGDVLAALDRYRRGEK